jgi:UDP-2,3-diacylglucosamine pyrophosphatase LpxH
MQIAVISDLHLGRGGLTDAFEHDDGEFLRFLSFLESNFERVVLLGDIWETLTAAPGGQGAELAATQNFHREIHQRFQRPRYRYVHGNHDLIAGAAMGAPEEYTLEADGVRMIFNHGHQGDRLCSHARVLSEGGSGALAYRQHTHTWLGLSSHEVPSRTPVESGAGRCPREQADKPISW